MLMPFFLLAGSSLVMFEQAIKSFDRAENENLEGRFPLAELKDHFSQAQLTVDALLKDPTNPKHRKDLQEWNVTINRHIESMLVSKSNLAERQNLLAAVGASWEAVYDATLRYPETLDAIALEGDEQALVASTLVSQIQNELKAAQEVIDTIEIKLANFQTYDNLKRARQLIQGQRLLVVCIALVAISIALLSALVLSRSVLQSMRVLIKGLEELSEGALDKRIEWHNSDEFGRLATAINSMAEKLAQSQQALIESATLDDLTGVFNRREFNRLLTIEIERSRRSSQPVSMIMVDIDHFKVINDTYGHQSGDNALQWVSSVLQREIRPGDIVARYGGEEFALILPNTDGENAGTVAERVRQKLSSERVPLPKGHTIALTASLGYATFPFIGDSEQSLVNAADQALYQAKDTGRNRVCHAQEDIDIHQKDIDIHQKLSA